MNVLLLIFDGVRYDHVDTGDHSDSPTPALSDFARTATEYTRAYAPSIWSLPSHVSLFTGHHSVAHGVNTISDTLQNGTTIWSELATRGYSTGLFSANPYLTLIDTGIQSEFDHVVGTTEIPFYEALTPDESSVTSGSQSPHLDYLRECFTSDSPFRSLINGIDSSITPLPFLYDDDTAPYFADQFLEWVDDQSGPWAGCLNFMDTHFPYLPSEEHNRWGDEQLFDIQDAIDEGMWEFTSGKRPWWQRRALSALYKGCIRQADAAVDRILSHLQQQDELDETLIVVTSDHGEGFGERSRVRPQIRLAMHGYGIHDALLHVPLLVRHPGQTQSTQQHELAEIRRFPAVVKGALSGEQTAGFQSQTNTVVTSSIERPATIASAREHHDGELPFTGDAHAVYEQSDDGIRKYTVWGDDAVVTDVQPASTAAHARTDIQQKVQQTIAAVEGKNLTAKGGNSWDLNENTERQLEKLGYL
jgi:arylsulfatase A-like enzyme